MLPAGYARLKLLFVDDDLPTRVLLRELLRGTGLQQVDIVDSAVTAFEMIRTDPPDLVFTDWQMQDRSGLDLLRDIRETSDSPDPLMPVILLTAKDGQDSVIQGRNAGATAYLLKPITLGGIVDRITDAVTKPRTFVVSPNYIGPDRRLSRSPIANDRRAGVTPAIEGTIIPPDHLLAAKVKGDRMALRQALQAHADAIALVRRIFQARLAA